MILELYTKIDVWSYMSKLLNFHPLNPKLKENWKILIMFEVYLCLVYNFRFQVQIQRPEREVHISLSRARPFIFTLQQSELLPHELQLDLSPPPPIPPMDCFISVCNLPKKEPPTGLNLPAETLIYVSVPPQK